MKVSKEKAIATFTYPYQSYGISFALDEINYEELYEAFAAPLICFEIDIAYGEEESIEHCFKLTVTKEKDLKVGLPDWTY